MSNNETAIANQILLALSGDGCLTWRQTVGKFRPIYSPETVLSIGTPGMADIGAVVPVMVTQAMVGRVIGVAAQIEVKTATGRAREDQIAWGAAVRNRGGLAGIARSPDEALRIIRSISHK